MRSWQLEILCELISSSPPSTTERIEDLKDLSSRERESGEVVENQVQVLEDVMSTWEEQRGEKGLKE